MGHDLLFRIGCDVLVSNGIFHPRTTTVFQTIESYKSWYLSQNDTPRYWIGLLTHHHFWKNKNLAVEESLIVRLETLGIGVIPVFSYASSEPEQETKTFESIICDYWISDSTLRIDALINFQMVAALGNGTSEDLYSQAKLLFKNMSIPVFRPLVSYFSTVEQWEQNPLGLSAEIAHAYTGNEMLGMIEPIIVGCRKEGLIVEPIPERIEKFCRRVRQWLDLRHTENKDKKIALMIHSAPCIGLESTIGTAAGLKVFESCYEILMTLKANGYTVENLPDSAASLRATFMEKKAIQDFRWTSVEDICSAGGDLYRVSVEDEYNHWIKGMLQKSLDQLTEMWGEAPGEGMVQNGKLVITGLELGHVVLMLQPKRGCYGPKCTGEVCKILHDPSCPPPHQYIATYKYIEHILKANAVIHVGTGSTLEYLPGKSNALSSACWPDLVLGQLLNLQIYNNGVGVEGTQSKRRAQGVIISHLPAAMGLPKHLIEEPNFKLLEGCHFGSSFKNHTFGSELSGADKHMYVWESAIGSVPDEATLKFEDLEVDFKDEFELMSDLSCEMVGLISALEGTYVSPGSAGNPSDGLCSVMPTGRNFHLMNIDHVPPKEAYEKGLEMANQFIEVYMNASGSYPESLAVNMISTDITETKGEQLSMVLNLLGVIPTWAPGGKVLGLEVISLKALGRPRIDCMVRISGVLRDAYPKAIDLIDQAVMLVAVLDESYEDNFIKRHVEESLEGILNSSCEALESEEADIQKRQAENLRQASIRIFGDKPGTYGTGVDLALKASAWTDPKEIAVIMTDFSGYAYGKSLEGKEAKSDFIQCVKQARATFEVTSSKRYDLLSSGFAAAVHGGLKALKSAVSQESLITYHCHTAVKGKRIVGELSDEASKLLEASLANEDWLLSQMDEGIEGSMNCMRRVQSVFDWQCLSECFEDQLLDHMTERLFKEESFKSWFLAVNPYAFEEVTRRLMELVQRKKWQPSKEAYELLQSAYLQADGEMEVLTESNANDIERQLGEVSIVSAHQVESWALKVKETERLVQNAIE